MEYAILGVIVLIANIYAIYSIFSSGASIMAKTLWTVAIILLPVVGFIVWLVAGPRAGSAHA